MSNRYQAGDLVVRTLTVTSARGTLDFTATFLSASIYESIFVPGTVADISINDTLDQLGQVKLSGDETVTFIYYVPGSVTANYTFALYDMGDLEIAGSQKGKNYVLKCVSVEAMYAKTNYVQKSYNQLCSKIVVDVHQSYLKSTKHIITEDTKGAQNIIIPHRNPYDAIALVRSRSISLANKSSSYVFFENRQKEQQTYNFVTIEGLFRNNPVKTFQQSSALATSIFKRDDNNIISYTIPRQFSSIDRIAFGGPRKITTFNFTTHQFEQQIIQTLDSLFASGGGGKSSVSAGFKSKYFNAPIPPQSLIPVDISQRATTNIPEGTPGLQAYIAVLMQNSMKIKVPGDTILTAGVTITANIPNKTATTSPAGLDPLMNGKFLISRIHHRIGVFQEKPRYTNIIECVKGLYQEGVS